MPKYYVQSNDRNVVLSAQTAREAAKRFLAYLQKHKGRSRYGNSVLIGQYIRVSERGFEKDHDPSEDVLINSHEIVIESLRGK
jgi:hypothetical protein